MTCDKCEGLGLLKVNGLDVVCKQCSGKGKVESSNKLMTETILDQEVPVAPLEEKEEEAAEVPAESSEAAADAPVEEPAGFLKRVFGR